MSIRTRPRFKELIPATQAEVAARLKEGLSDSPYVGFVMPNHAVIKIPPEERHFWSPQLAVSFEEDEEGRGTVVRGLYGPNPMIWALVFYGYAASGLLALFVAIAGFSEWYVKGSAPVLWTLPIFGVVALVVYILGQTGQRVGEPQTRQLNQFMETMLHDSIVLR